VAPTLIRELFLQVPVRTALMIEDVRPSLLDNFGVREYASRALTVSGQRYV